MTESNNNGSIFTRRSMILIMLTAALLATALVTLTMAKFTSEESADSTVVLEDFNAVLHLYYTDSDNETQEVTITNTDSYAELTLDEFEKASISLEYVGDAKTYCRFKVDCSFIHYIDEDGDEVYEVETVPHTYPEFDYDSTVVYDNMDEDGYFYIKGILPDDITVPSPVLTVTDIGQDVGDLVKAEDYSTHVRVGLTVDCVQFNRVAALWQITQLPWV